MKRIFPFILFLSCVSAPALWAQSGTQASSVGSREKLDIYLLIGQSNMAGRAPISDADKGELKRCHLLNQKDAWEPAKNPFNRYSSIRKSLGMQKMNPGYGFAKTMLEKNPDISMGLVVNAKGGTRIQQWKKGGSFYDEAVRRSKEAQKTGTLKGVLWHQGESNSKNPDKYLEHLKELITDLRKDLNAPELPFVAGQVFHHPKKKPQTERVNAEIAKLPEVMPFTAYVEARGLTTFDNTHFDAEGMKLLGKRYAEKMMKLQGASKSR